MKRHVAARRWRVLSAAAAGFIASFPHHAAAQSISYTTAASVYSQDFDTLPSSGTFSNQATAGPFHFGSAPYSFTGMNGWYYWRHGGSTTRFTVSDGSNGAGSAYSYGAVSSGERALGLLASNSNTSTIGAVFVNNTGAAISRFQIDFTGEQWRSGGTASNTLAFSYALGAAAINSGTFVPTAGANFVSPNLSGVNDQLSGNDPSNQTAITATVSNILWTPGQTLVLRWQDTDDSGSDQGLAVDDFSFSAFAPRSLTWNPGSTTWNATNSNWLNGATPTDFDDGDTVNFTNAGVGTVTIDATGVAPTATIVSNSTGTYIFTGGSINGPGQLLKSNAGTLALTAANAYSGGTQINGGALSVGDNSHLGDSAGGVSFNGGTLLATGNVTSTRAVTLNAGGGTINTNGNDVSFATATGSGPLTKLGAGTLTFSGNVGVSGAPVPLTIGAGTLLLSAASATSHLAAPSAGTINGDIIINSATGKRVNFTTGTFSGTGQIIVQSGSNAISVDGSAGGFTPVINLPIILNATTTRIGVAGANTLTIGGIVSGDSNVVFDSDIDSSAGGAGTLLLNAANIWTGSTTINNASSGVVRLGANDALPTGTALMFNNINAANNNVGALDLNGKNQTVASIASSNVGTLNGIVNTGAAATLTVNGSADTTYAGSIGIPANLTNLAGANDNISLALHASNTGITTLSRASTYSGGTAINGGTLRIANTSGSATGSGMVTVNNGGTLDGTGKITGAVQVNSGGTLAGSGTVGAVTVASGGILAPGASVGSLKAPSLSLAGGSQLAFEFGGGDTDGVTLTGAANNFTANGGAFTFTATGIPTPGFYTLIDYAGAIQGGGFAALSNSTPSAGGYGLALHDNSSNSSVDLWVTINGAAMRAWQGSPGNAWDNTSTNWQEAGPFSSGEQALFNDSAGGSTSISVSGTVSPAWIYFSNSVLTYALSGGDISGTGGLSKSSAGDVTLSGTNTFSGPVSIRDGKLIAASIADSGNASSIGAGTIIIIGAGGTLRYTGAAAGTNRAVTLTPGGSTIDVFNSSTEMTLSGQIGGTGTLTKAGPGRLILSNPANNYQGATLISAGALQNGTSEVVPDGSALTIAAGALYDTGSNSETVGSIAGAGDIIIGAGQVITTGGDGTSTTHSGSITGAGTLNKIVTATLSLHGSNSFTGQLVIAGGAVGINSGAAIADVADVRLDTGGTLKAEANLSTDRTITVGTTSGAIDTNGFHMTVNAALATSTTTLNKNGAGTLELTVPSPNRNGPTIINGGVLKVSGGTTDAIGGNGKGSITVNNGGTFHIDNLQIGQSTPVDTRFATRLNNGATLMGSGSSGRLIANDLTIQSDAGTEVTFKTASASDVFTVGSTVRNPAGNLASGAKIIIDGPGTIVLGSGATSTSDAFSGSWEVRAGTLQVGPPVATAEPMNSLGYAAAIGPNGPTRPIALKSGGTLQLAIAAPPTSIEAKTFRSPITLDGGAIAPRGVDGTFGGNITLASTSAVNTTDPIDSSARKLVFATQKKLTGVTVTDGTFAWGNATLNVNGSGTLRFERAAPQNIGDPSSAVSVTPGATLAINNSATVELGADLTSGSSLGTADHLSDGSNHVNVVNNSSASVGFDVQSGTKNIGTLGGSGNTSVTSSAATLVATHIRQNALTIGGKAKIRPNGAAGGTSKVTSLVISTGGGQQFDIADNHLIVKSYPNGAGTYIGGPASYNGIAGLVKSGMGPGGAPFWDGEGLVTSMTAATSGISTTLAVASASNVGKTVFGGLSVDPTDALVMYTYNGDANLSGNVDADDYWIIDSNYNDSGTKFGFYNGDFDYDGDIDGDDYVMIDAGFAGQGPAFIPSAPVDGVASVPEPGNVALVGLSMTGMLKRRRRRISRCGTGFQPVLQCKSTG